MVLKKFIELAEQKVTEAQAKADQVQSSIESATPTATVEDLEALETPETILLATVSGELSKDRTDRAIVTPWLKFLWETYRTVLEILKNNARLEIMYQSTALQAFQFCLKYQRKTEFRRLCELLRNHVTNAAKYSSQMHAINLNDPDTLQRHLDTRFQQLNVAVELELWQEAFRSIEDIHMLLTLSKRPAKNIMMANYYEKLTKIFLVSDNFLFHAAAWNRYYNLLRQSAAAVASGSLKRDNPVISEAEMSKSASFVVLSALAIPVISTSRSRGVLVDVDEARKNKSNRLTNLLSMPSTPSRASLFKDIEHRRLLQFVRPEIKELYDILEVTFHPLSICKKISPILTRIGADPEMEKYVLPLQQVILTRLFQQLSQVYDSVALEFVTALAQFPEPFAVSSSTIEKFIMNGCKKGDLAIRLDHVSGILTFDSDVFSSAKSLQSGQDTEASSIQRLQNTPAEIARSQLARLAKTLHITCMYVDSSFNNARFAAQDSAFARAAEGAEREHEEILARRGVIEKQKEAATEALTRKQREEETRKRIRVQQAAEAESQRLRDETKARELKRINDEKTRIRRQEMEKQLEELKSGAVKIDLQDIDVDDLDTNAIRTIKLTQLEKQNAERDARIRTTAKRIDHLERALRREELHHLPEDYEKQKQRDQTYHEEARNLELEESKAKHAESVQLKNKLGRLVDQYDDFKRDLNERRHEEFERRRKKAEQEFEAAKRKRVKEVADRKAAERRAAEEEEEKQREEEERQEREVAEKAAAEEEKKRNLAERRAKAEADRSEREEAARKQMQREEEAEARRAARKNQPESKSQPERAAPMESRTDSNERTAPRVSLATRPGGAGGGWREREAARAAAAGSQATAEVSDAPAVQEPAPRKTGGYLPPAMREGAPKSFERDQPPRSFERESRDHAPRSFDREPRDSPRTFEREPSARNESPANGVSSAAPDSETARKPTPGKWVPPHLRNRG